jgi:hypothetical protein
MFLVGIRAFIQGARAMVLGQLASTFARAWGVVLERFFDPAGWAL